MIIRWLMLFQESILMTPMKLLPYLLLSHSSFKISKKLTIKTHRQLSYLLSFQFHHLKGITLFEMA